MYSFFLYIYICTYIYIHRYILILIVRWYWMMFDMYPCLSRHLQIPWCGYSIQQNYGKQICKGFNWQVSSVYHKRIQTLYFSINPLAGTRPSSRRLNAVYGGIFEYEKYLCVEKYCKRHHHSQQAEPQRPIMENTNCGKKSGLICPNPVHHEKSIIHNVGSYPYVS